MSLDFQLIEQSTKYSSDQLKNVTKTDCPDLLFLTDFLYPPLVDKLINFVTTNELDWQKEVNIEYAPRYKINWITDTVIEETHTALENLTIPLNSQFDKNNKFIGMTVWKDNEGFTIGKHDRDNEIIDMSIQVYLTEDLTNLGTSFIYNNKIIQANYTKNCGYLYDNNRGVTHYMDTPVPKGHVRYSLYAMWSRIA